jgi:signal transduction histidine kinase
VLSKIDDLQMRQDQTAKILEQSNSILHLVEDLVQMTRLDSVRTLPRAPVDLSAVVSMAVQDARMRYQDRRINFQLELNPDLPAAQASETDLYLALCKLIANAVRYSPVGGDVTVRTGSSASSLFIEVRDWGSGIMPQDLARVFERFYRADEAHTTSGFGLGLPIAQRVANLHGGSLDIQSVPNKGSTFTLRLPATLTQ